VTAARVQLKHFVRINSEVLGEDTPLDREFRYIDIASTGRGKLVEAPELMAFGEAPTRARRIVRCGDTLISTVRTYLRAVWTSMNADEDLVASTGFACLRPTAQIDPRFLGWLAQSDAVVEEVVARSVGVSYPAISPAAIGTIKVALPSIEEQRVIAGYLDHETARIDALIEKKQRMRELAEARWQATLEGTIRELSLRVGDTRLKYACREVVVGIVITPSAWYAELGVPALRGLNVKPGRISTEDMVSITNEGHLLHAKSRLHSGDVVVVRTGQAGAAAVVPPTLGGSNCIDLVIIRPGERLRPGYLELVLNSDWMQKHIQEHTVGTIQGHFNVGAAKNVPIPVPELVEQERVTAVLLAARDRRDRIVGGIERQVELLQERRQALITAAVTGQIDAAEAA